jgi:hypothetical protein
MFGSTLPSKSRSNIRVHGKDSQLERETYFVNFVLRIFEAQFWSVFGFFGSAGGWTLRGAANDTLLVLLKYEQY